MGWLRRWRFFIEGVSLLATSVLGSLFAQSILNTRPVVAWAAPSFPVALFYAFLSIAVVSSLLNSRARRLEQIQQVEMTGELHEMVRTQPPTLFLQSMGSAWRKSFGAYLIGVDLEGGDSEEDVDLSVRVVLESLCGLADDYNSEQQGSYTASVLMFVDSGACQRSTRDILEAQMRFAGLDWAFESLSGCLWLNEAWTVGPKDDGSVVGEAIVPQNTTVHPLALPIPKTASKRLRDGSMEWYVLPGGPRCFVEGGALAVPDTLNVAAWMKLHMSSTQQLRDEVDDYMRQRAEGGRFRAFLSLPLRDPESERMLGVINLESTSPGFFSARSLGAEEDGMGAKRVEEFSNLALPFVSLVGALVRHLDVEAYVHHDNDERGGYLSRGGR